MSGVDDLTERLDRLERKLDQVLEFQDVVEQIFTAAVTAGKGRAAATVLKLALTRGGRAVS